MYMYNVCDTEKSIVSVPLYNCFKLKMIKNVKFMLAPAVGVMGTNQLLLSAL